MRRPNFPADQPLRGGAAVEEENDLLESELKGKVSALKSLTIDIGHEVRYQNKMLNEMFDCTKECGALDAALEEMLAKVEEFSSLLDMMADCSGSALSETVPRLWQARQPLQQLFNRVDAVETFVNTAGDQVSRLEQQVQLAESRLTSPAPLTQTLSALWQNRRVDAAEEPMTYTPPEVFQSEAFFHRRDEPAE